MDGFAQSNFLQKVYSLVLSREIFSFDIKG